MFLTDGGNKGEEGNRKLHGCGVGNGGGAEEGVDWRVGKDRKENIKSDEIP